MLDYNRDSTLSLRGRGKSPFVVQVGICACLLLTIAMAPAVWAKQLLVGPSGTGPCTFSSAPYGSSVCTTSQFCSIQSAVNAAHNGDEIDVCPGTYSEQVVVTKNLNIFGPNAGSWWPSGRFPSGQAIIKPGSLLAPNTNNLFSGLPIAAILLEQGVNNSQLSNITVDGAGNSIDGCVDSIIGIYYQNANGLVQSNEAKNIMPATDPGCLGGSAIFVQSGAGGSSNVQLLFNSVHDYEKNGITANEQGTQVVMTGNISTGSGNTAITAQNGIQLGFNATGQLSTNNAANNLYSGCSLSSCFAAGTNIIVPSTAGTGHYWYGRGYGNHGYSNNGNGNGNGNGSGNGHGNGNGSVSVDNNVTNIADINIFLDEVANVDVSNNVVFQSVLDGIRMVGSFNNRSNQIQANTIANNGEAGIYVDGQNNDIDDNTVNGAVYGIFANSANNQIDNDNTFYNTVNAVVDPPANSFTVSPYR